MWARVSGKPDKAVSALKLRVGLLVAVLGYKSEEFAGAALQLLLEILITSTGA